MSEKVVLKNLIYGALKMNGISVDRASRVMRMTTRTFYDRMAHPELFRAQEIRELRKLIPDEICDKITR
ncbi:MAG: hypothetical protein IJ110_01515 [Lachnospiraceae bacterium]|nr:hypothetical protein [Lachnospiraceae bacterium]